MFTRIKKIETPGTTTAVTQQDHKLADGKVPVVEESRSHTPCGLAEAETHPATPRPVLPLSANRNALHGKPATSPELRGA